MLREWILTLSSTDQLMRPQPPAKEPTKYQSARCVVTHLLIALALVIVWSHQLSRCMQSGVDLRKRA